MYLLTAAHPYLLTTSWEHQLFLTESFEGDSVYSLFVHTVRETTHMLSLTKVFITYIAPSSYLHYLQIITLFHWISMCKILQSKLGIMQGFFLMILFWMSDTSPCDVNREGLST